jgi:3-oxoacyl-[acyl-carrier-protein] synthase-1
MPAVITASSVLCAGGRGTEQLWATVRAGISCIKSSGIVDRRFELIQMGLVPQDVLAPLPVHLESAGLPSAVRRMLQLAGPTFAAVAASAVPTPVVVYLGLPQLEPIENPWIGQFLELLSLCADVPINVASSRIFPAGRASSLLAMEAALTELTTDPGAIIAVGGVDTFLDLRRIAMLDDEERILCATVMDGFIPGEGAAFLVLQSASASTAGAIVHGAAGVADPGHRYGTAPALGEGLAHALDKLRATATSEIATVGTTFAGFNGESFESKLWGVARLRHTDLFAPDMVMQHPVDVIGDTGAAAGAILTALAAHAVSNNQRRSSALIWAASDHESRGCALVSA